MFKWKTLILCVLFLFAHSASMANASASKFREEYIRSAGEFLGKCYIGILISERHCKIVSNRSLGDCISQSTENLPRSSFQTELTDLLKKNIHQLQEQIAKAADNIYDVGIKNSNGNLDDFCQGVTVRMDAAIRESKDKLKIASLPFVQSSQGANKVSISRVQVDQRVSIEVPSNWTVLTSTTRERIQSGVDTFSENTAIGDLRYAANLYDESGKTKAFVNLRFYPTNEFSQSDAKGLTPASIRQIDSEVRVADEKLSRALNFNIIQPTVSTLVQINGVYMLRQEKIIESQVNKERSREIKYRVWAAPRSFTLTLSVKSSQEKELLDVVERIGRSLKVDLN